MHRFEIKEIQKVTVWGMFANILLAAIKFVVGFIGSSQAVIADAVHSVSDIATDLAVILGVKFWAAPPDENHPYGHRKIESIVTFAIGGALAVVAVGISYDAFSSIKENNSTAVNWIAIVGPAISIVLKEFLYQWTVKVGRTVKSSAVIANAWHHRSDALSSIPALAGVLVAVIYPQFSFADLIGAIIVSLFILKVSWDIVKPALQELTDYGIHEEEISKIEANVMAIEGVEDTHKIRTRKSGSSVFVDLHVLVNPDISVREGHEISTVVKHTLIADFSEIVDVVVHLEPFEGNHIK